MSISLEDLISTVKTSEADINVVVEPEKSSDNRGQKQDLAIGHDDSSFDVLNSFLGVDYRCG